ARLVQALVALQPEQVRAEHAGEHLAQLGLAGAGWALREQRLLEREGQEERRLDSRRGDVARLAEAAAHLLERHVHPVTPAAVGCAARPRTDVGGRAGGPNPRT